MLRSDMDGMNRRDFLRASGVTGAGALLAGANIVTFEQAAQASQPVQLGNGILVIITMYGGNDGLNTVIPYADSVYQSRRAGLAFGEAEVLPIGDGLGLNPGMTGMRDLWTQGRMAIVRGVGYPNPNHSHFSSMDIWQSASPDAPSKSGWIGRWLDTLPKNSMNALNIGNTLPPMLVGSTTAGSTLPTGGLKTPTGTLKSAFKNLSRLSADANLLHEDAATAIADLYSNSNATSAALRNAVSTAVPGDSAEPTPVGTSELAQQLDVVARLINAGATTRIYSVSIGGFDTHADEKSKQTALLADLSNSIATFMRQIDNTQRHDDVTLFAYSEFGRRVPANLSQGTDHGTAGPAFVVGNRIAGGFYGEQPSLTDLVADDLRVTTDFRDIYGTLLERGLGADSGASLGTWKGRLPLFKA